MLEREAGDDQAGSDESAWAWSLVLAGEIAAIVLIGLILRVAFEGWLGLA